MLLPASSTRHRRPIGAVTCTRVVVALLGLGSLQARAADAEPSPTLGRVEIQQLHEGCQRQIDEGRAVEAAQCLRQVYDGLVTLDGSATVDLYYVLSDAVASLEAASKEDPRALCLAARMIEDYRKREARLSARRYANKVAALQRKVRETLGQARGAGGRDVCLEEPPTSVEASEVPAVPTAVGGTGEAPGDGVSAEPVAAPVVTGRVTATRPSAPVQRKLPRRQLFEARLPYTALLDASFGVTLAGVAGAGVGAALYIYGLECKDGPPRCSGVAPTGVRDAGLVLMSAGAATMIVGFGLRFADHRKARAALRNMPRPVASPTTVGLAWAARF